jgi:hypothetical protein
MSNLKLVPDAPTPLEKLLLEASRNEQPSEDHKARLRAALGIGLPLSGPLVAPPPAGPAPSPAAAAKAAGKSLSAAKAAVGVAALALVGVLVLARQGAEPADSSIKIAPPAAVVKKPELPSGNSVQKDDAIAVSPLPPIEQPSEVASRPARGAASPASSADLSEQIRLIEAARAGVAARDAGSALAALDSYAAKYPRGAFGQEAMVLRIRALDQSGDFARATSLAKSFVARFPQSPHVARLKPIAERGASR